MWRLHVHQNQFLYVGSISSVYDCVCVCVFLIQCLCLFFTERKAIRMLQSNKMFDSVTCGAHCQSCCLPGPTAAFVFLFSPSLAVAACLGPNHRTLETLFPSCASSVAAAAWSALPPAMVTAGSSSFSSTVLHASLLRGSFGPFEAAPASCTPAVL